MQLRTLLTTVLVGLAQRANAQAMMRFGCSQLVVERLDP